MDDPREKLHRNVQFMMQYGELGSRVGVVGQSFNSLFRALHKATDATTKLNHQWQKVTESYYLAAHNKLPGSLRTKRLRKKRLSRIHDFFAAGVRV